MPFDILFFENKFCAHKSQVTAKEPPPSYPFVFRTEEWMKRDLIQNERFGI